MDPGTGNIYSLLPAKIKDDPTLWPASLNTTIHESSGVGPNSKDPLMITESRGHDELQTVC